MIASFEPHKGTFFPLFECHTAIIITALDRLPSERWSAYRSEVRTAKNGSISGAAFHRTAQ
jgi:hypothetical protein